MGAKADELTAMIQSIRERVRSQHPNGPLVGNVTLPDLLPLVHARDAAEGKVASIGTVNPRPPGLKNSLIQWVKNLVARALDWHVREQVEFNRAMVNCVQATIEAMNESNRALSALGGGLSEAQKEASARAHMLQEEARQLKDIRHHWAQWRQEWESKLSTNEISFLRSLSDLQGAWQHRVTLLDQEFRDYVKSMHADFQHSLHASNEAAYQHFRTDLEKIRDEYEALIHTELRLMRQKTTLVRAGAAAVAQVAATDGLTHLDWMKFAEKFRGTEEYAKRHLKIYVDRFTGAANVLDIGCGRGELLEMLRNAGIPAHGIDLNDDCVAACKAKGLAVEKADLFEYLEGQPNGTLGGVAMLQVVEHLPPARLPELVALVHAKLRTQAWFVIETPNPECLAIFARHFYLDPTHAKPVPAPLMGFYLEEAGFGRLDSVRLEPAIDSMPSLASLPEDFRKDFFGSLDYAIFGRKL